MMEMNYNGWRIHWLHNPREVKGIRWNEIDFPADTTIHFQDDGDGCSKYVFAHRIKDNKLVKVAKATRFPLLLFVGGEVLGYLGVLYQFLDAHSAYVSLACMYAILLLVCGHYWWNQHELPKKTRTD